MFLIYFFFSAWIKTMLSNRIDINSKRNYYDYDYDPNRVVIGLKRKLGIK